ncbi:HAMP domain-containing histidine kinase [Akkermansiaceae bacterium]|nr:HAMP domain-containing histidine kinase [Akkermansiaceae bacterium]
MRNRNCWVWIAFACCACLVVGAMLWLTRSVIKTENDRALAEIRAELQERVRLSLWRMDSLGASILLEENSIPPQVFLDGTKTALPVTVRFETPDGAAFRGIGPEKKLMEIGIHLSGLITDFKAAEPQDVAEGASDKKSTPAPPEEHVSQLQSKIRGGWEAQANANIAEKANRERLLGDNIYKGQSGYSVAEDAAGKAKQGSPSPEEMPKPLSQALPSISEIPNPTGNFKATWFEGSLYLIRRGMNMQSFAQGILVDEAALRGLLLSEATQLLPQASLAPATNGAGDSFNLASLPFRLSPGNLASIEENSIPRSISVSLLAGWLAAMVALLAAFLLIANVMKLSERRASFVSAVTHELRTPLTTFRLYSDMLSTGAVREEKRPAYLNVLSREADRLSHLVENVLAFSKIERGSARSDVSETDLNALLESFAERFSTRLDSAGLSLDLRLAEPVRVKLDASALEHILFNLIDNAAKYAAFSEPSLVTLETKTGKKNARISISDHGPGISGAECRRIFRPFHKSAKQAAETKPGVGLGLALSKRLAGSMGGALSCHKRPDGKPGAVFSLTLPRE